MVLLVLRAQLRRHLAFARAVAIVFFRRWWRLRGLRAIVAVKSRRINVVILWRGFRLRGAVLGEVAACRLWCGVVELGGCRVVAVFVCVLWLVVVSAAAYVVRTLFVSSSVARVQLGTWAW